MPVFVSRKKHSRIQDLANGACTSAMVDQGKGDYKAKQISHLAMQVF